MHLSNDKIRSPYTTRIEGRWFCYVSVLESKYDTRKRTKSMQGMLPELVMTILEKSLQNKLFTAV